MIQDFGRYNILLKLGQGGMGAVYLARHKTLKRFCVIKVISPQLAHDPEISERLLREARAAASLSHPHLVNVFDCDRYEGQYFIAMEYVEGVTIIEAIRNFQFFPLPFALHCLYQAAKGLEYIHGRGIIHRDIKPDNMIIDHRGTVKIMDLGLAKDRIEDVSLTTTGTVMGSPYYISPEQIEDIKSVDGRSDLYSLGISFYQMLMGQVPFSGPTAAKIFISHLNDPVPPVNAGSEELNAGLNQIIARLTAKKKEDRYPDAAALVQELEPWITAYPVHLSTNSFFANLGFENHAIAFLLEREGLKGVNVDADYPSLSSPEDILKTRVGEKKPTAPLFSAPSSSPALSYSFPNETQADFQPPVKSNAGKWALISGALVLSLIAAVFFIKTNQKSGSDELGRIEITAEPESSKITVAGNALSSPAKFDKVTPGTHTLEITAEGHKKLTKPVEIKPGPNPPLHFVLPKSRGWASIESIPPGAAIVQNNTLLGNTPFRVEGNPGESNEYVLKLVGYQ
ncbi:MAG: serine/threonine-protein kinase, partial [Verrucomicrobiota bacterium]|nr:serine/threonine-protein kinase [Verrucomicrobiota bacterium]